MNDLKKLSNEELVNRHEARASMFMAYNDAESKEAWRASQTELLRRLTLASPWMPWDEAKVPRDKPINVKYKDGKIGTAIFNHMTTDGKDSSWEVSEYRECGYLSYGSEFAHYMLIPDPPEVR
jgi:hypothetical protein